MGTVIIVVADFVRARFFSQTSRGAPLRLIDEILRPDAGLRNQDLVSDRPGRPHGRPQDAYNPQQTAKETEQERMAADIAARVDKARVAGRFDELVLVMGPRLLGGVRKELPDGSARKIALTVESDVAQLDENQLTEYLRGKWFVPEATREAIPMPPNRVRS